MDQTPSPNTMPSSKKKWIIILIVGVLVLAALVAAVMLLLNKPQKTIDAPKHDGPKEFTVQPSDKVMSYAGNNTYDACNLVSFDTVRANIANYQTLLDSTKTNQRPTQPLVIEHHFIDRNISAVLGKDGQERAKGTVIGSTGNDGISPFVSTFDSNCWYGQGEGISQGRGATFVKTYVMQKPTPISGELLSYLNSLTPRQVEKGVNLYLEDKRDSANFVTIIAVNEAKNAVAVFKTGSPKIADSAVADLIKTLSEPPKGVMTATYPEPWTKMPNPCELLTAADFERHTGKPASALAGDAIFLTDVGDGQMKRTCQRLEVERLNGGEISESDVTVRMAKSVDAAKNYVAGLKADQQDIVDIQPLSQPIEGTDDSYVRIEGVAQKTYAIEMRVGATFIAVNVKTEAGQDASVDTFVERMQPIAREVLSRLK
jgi:hypothetical protein